MKILRSVITVRSLLLILALGLPIAIATQAAKADTITLSTNDYPPYNASSLPQNGIVSAISRAALAHAGDQLIIRFRPWQRALQEAQSGETNGILSLWYSKERSTLLAYSHPIYANEIGFYARKNTSLDVSDLSRLKPLKIGVVRGYLNPQAFDAARLSTELANDDADNLMKLAAGRVDLILIDKQLARYLLSTRLKSIQDQLIWLEPVVDTLQLYVAFSKKSPGWEKRLAHFNAGLAAAQQDGTLSRLKQQLGY